MSNKTWKYTVAIQNPEDWQETPAKRRELALEESATSAPRAIAKVRKRVATEWEMEARHVEVLDACRSHCYRNDKAEQVDE